MLRKQRCTVRGRKATDVWALQKCSEPASRPITRGAQRACKVTCQIVEGSASDVGGWSADVATRPIHGDHITSPGNQAHPGRPGRILSDTGQLTTTTSTTMTHHGRRAQAWLRAGSRVAVRSFHHSYTFVITSERACVLCGSAYQQSRWQPEVCQDIPFSPLAVLQQATAARVC